MKVGDRDAWVLQFELDFTAESEKKDYKWKKENGAIVLMDRGDGRRPAMVYMSVPDNLGTDVVERRAELAETGLNGGTRLVGQAGGRNAPSRCGEENE